MTDIVFTVDTFSPHTIKVSWQDANYLYNFLAKMDGDQITQVLKGARRWPVVYRRKHSGGRADVLNAADFAPIVLSATRAIRNGKLATQARHAREDRRRAQHEARVAETATRVRKALDQVGQEYDAIAEALALPQMRQRHREGIIEVMSLDDASLYRLACILGCD